MTLQLLTLGFNIMLGFNFIDYTSLGKSILIKFATSFKDQLNKM